MCHNGKLNGGITMSCRWNVDHSALNLHPIDQSELDLPSLYQTELEAQLTHAIESLQSPNRHLTPGTRADRGLACPVVDGDLTDASVYHEELLRMLKRRRGGRRLAGASDGSTGVSNQASGGVGLTFGGGPSSNTVPIFTSEGAQQTQTRVGDGRLSNTNTHTHLHRNSCPRLHSIQISHRIRSPT